MLLPFVDDAVLLVSSNSDLQLELGRFAAECQAVGMTISMSQAMLLGWKKVDCKLWVSEQMNDSAEIIKKLCFLVNLCLILKSFPPVFKPTVALIHQHISITHLPSR